MADFSRLGALVAIWGLLALALNLQWGHTGLFNAGIVGFWALGAYAGALVTTDPALPVSGYPGHWGIGPGAFPTLFGVRTAFFFGALLAGALAATVAFLVAIPALRLRADYFAIATLALAQVTIVSLKNMDPITGGDSGVPSIPRPFEFGSQTHVTEFTYFVLVAVLLVLAYLIFERLGRSPWGRALRALREDEDAAQAIGKDTFLLKLEAFVLGAATIGVSGALFAYFLRNLGSPDLQFPASYTFLVFVMVLIGGPGNNRGVLLGAFLILFLEFFTIRAKDWFALSPELASKVFYLRLIAIGVILVVLVLFRPQGIFPEPKHATKKPRWLWG